MAKKEHIVKIPNRFWDDHADRFASHKDLKWKEENRTARESTVRMNDKAYKNLVGDARHYADKDGGPDYESRGISASARATLKRLSGK